jgi:hypothetical protein
MPQVNYNNPNAMDPRGSYEPSGALAGWHRFDRMKDFETARDTAQEAGMLSNLRARSELADYNAAGPAREMEYSNRYGAARNALALQPDQHRLNTMNQQADLQAAPYMNEFKVWEAMQKIPAAKRNEQISQTLKISQLLRGVPEGQDLSQLLPQLNQSGVDVSRWKDKAPQQVHKELSFLRGLDPDAFKAITDMDKTRFTEGQSTSRNDADNRTAIEVAKINAAGQGQNSAAGAKVAQMNNWVQRLTDIQTRYYENGGKFSSAAEQAEYNAIHSAIKSAEAAGGATLQVQSQAGPAGLNILQGKPAGATVSPPTSNVAPKAGAKGNNIESVLKSQGKTYDPKKFEYKLDEKGNVWAKPKGK